MLGEFNHYVNDKVKRKKRTVSLYTVPYQICKKRGYKYFSALRWTQIISLMKTNDWLQPVQSSTITLHIANNRLIQSFTFVRPSLALPPKGGTKDRALEYKFSLSSRIKLSCLSSNLFWNLSTTLSEQRRTRPGECIWMHTNWQSAKPVRCKLLWGHASSQSCFTGHESKKEGSHYQCEQYHRSERTPIQWNIQRF